MDAATPAYNPAAPSYARAVADLIIIAFFFLLRVGEYTMPLGNRRTRTVQFRLKDVKFWKNGTVVAHTVPLNQLNQCDMVTLFLDNQKNGQRGDTMNHHKVHSVFDPVSALARRVKAIKSFDMPPDTPLSFVSPGRHVEAASIVQAVRASAIRTGLPAKGYDTNRVAAHSLRASGAMALRLAGYTDGEIMKFGRWRSTTFLTYIHSQIGALSRGVATRMSRMISFVNVAG
jgi:integrase